MALLDTYMFKMKLSELCETVRQAERSGDDAEADELYSEVAAAYDQLASAYLNQETTPAAAGRGE